MSDSVETGTPALAGKRANWTIAHKVTGTVIEWQVKGAGALKLDVALVHEKIRERAAIHGLVQRVSDAAAMSRNTETGKPASAQDKHDAMKRLVEHYASGASEWTLRAAGAGEGRGGLGLSGAALLREALAIAKPASGEEKIAGFVKGLNQKQIAALLIAEELKEAVQLAKEAAEQRLRAGVGSEQVDVEAMLEGL